MNNLLTQLKIVMGSIYTSIILSDVGFMYSCIHLLHMVITVCFIIFQYFNAV
jgi:hypothetical protein